MSDATLSAEQRLAEIRELHARIEDTRHISLEDAAALHAAVGYLLAARTFVLHGWCSDCGAINEHYDHCITRRTP